MYQVVLFYNYVKIDDPEAEKLRQIELCERLNLKARMIIAEEGVNGNFEGLVEDTEKYIAEMTKDPRFADTHWKRSPGDGRAFPKINIKVRPEILSIGLGEENFDPNEVSGKYMTAEELHQLYEDGEEFYVVDMRNNFEHRVGYFDESIKMPLNAMRELPENMQEIEHLRDKKVVTVCTGGIKCEKASGYLVQQGFTDVYQLHGGIHDYIEKFPNQHFKGKLYVYDGRVVMGFELDSPEHQVVSKCSKCGKTSDYYADCAYKQCKDYRHFVCCEECRDEFGQAYCSDVCKQAHQEQINSAAVTTAQMYI